MSLAEEEKVDRGSTETTMRRGNFGRMRSHVGNVWRWKGLILQVVCSELCTAETCFRSLQLASDAMWLRWDARGGFTAGRKEGREDGVVEIKLY